MVVQSLRHELQRQTVLVAAGLFNLGPLVLEPDFNLGLVQVQFLGEGLSPLLCYVPVGLELGFESLQLLSRKRRPGPLVLLAVLLLLQFPCPWAWRGNNKGNKNIYSTAGHHSLINPPSYVAFVVVIPVKISFFFCKKANLLSICRGPSDGVTKTLLD